MKTIFARIIAGELPAERVFENERILAIKDLYPVAPVHLLIMPKEEITCLNDASCSCIACFSGGWPPDTPWMISPKR